MKEIKLHNPTTLKIIYSGIALAERKAKEDEKLKNDSRNLLAEMSEILTEYGEWDPEGVETGVGNRFENEYNCCRKTPVVEKDFLGGKAHFVLRDNFRIGGKYASYRDGVNVYADFIPSSGKRRKGQIFSIKQDGSASWFGKPATTTDIKKMSGLISHIAEALKAKSELSISKK